MAEGAGSGKGDKAVVQEEKQGKKQGEEEEEAVLGEEGNVGSSVSAALNLAMRKGYLAQERKRAAQTSSKLADLASKHSQMEERGPEDDDDRRRDSRRDRSWDSRGSRSRDSRDRCVVCFLALLTCFALIGLRCLA